MARLSGPASWAGNVIGRDMSNEPTENPAPAEVTAAELEQLRSAAAKAAEAWDKLLRTTADLENYKKRAARERVEAETAAQTRVLSRFLPVLDNFEMALAAVSGAADPAARKLRRSIGEAPARRSREIKLPRRVADGKAVSCGTGFDA